MDVRYLLDDLIHSLAYGHYKIAAPPVSGGAPKARAQPTPSGQGSEGGRGA